MSTTDLAMTPAQAKAELPSLVSPEVADQAKMLVASGVFPSMKSVSEAIVAIELGKSLGLAPAQAMTGISIVEGRPFIGANVLARAVKLSEKYDYRVVEHTTETCRIDFYETVDGERVVIGTSEYTIAEATEAGAQFTSRNGHALPWKKFPRNMLFARALSNGVKWFCPDAVDSTVYVTEERDLLPEVDVEVVEPEPLELIGEEEAAMLAKHAEDSTLSEEKIATLCHAYGLPESDELIERLKGLTTEQAGAFAAEIGVAVFEATPETEESVEGEVVEEGENG